MVISKGKLKGGKKTRSKACSLPFRTPQIPQELGWDRNPSLRCNMPPMARLCGLLSVRTRSVYAYIHTPVL